MNTRIFIDVDGVVNAYDGRMTIPSWGWPRENGRHVQVAGFGIVYSPDMVSRLGALAARPGTEMFWLTTWEAGDAVLELADAIGIGGDWKIVYRAGYPEEPWWKLNAMLRLTDGYEGKVVWIDDDITFVTDAREWLASTDLDVLEICPDTKTGITMAQMTKIERFLE